MKFPSYGKLAFILALSLLLSSSAMLPVYVVSAASAKPSRAELLVKFKSGVSRHAGEALLRSLGARVVDEIPQIDVLVISVPEAALTRFTTAFMRSLGFSFPERLVNVRLTQAKFALMRNPMVEFVEENRLIEPSQTPNDPYYWKQWHLVKINGPDAWEISTGGGSVVIAVLDSGVDPSHPDLAGKLLSGWNFYDNNDDTADVYGHGTIVAGAAAAIANNGVGVASVAWNCPILPIRVTDKNGYAYYSTLSKGLIYAADRGARVAVMSFQIFDGALLSSAAKYFVDKGGVVVAAAGNTGKYESYNDNQYIVSVSATTSSDSLARFSSYGPYVDISAPGESIYTTFSGGKYASTSGTSLSAPVAAGVVALILSANPSLMPCQAERILEASAADLGGAGYDVYYGWGRVDAYAALKMASNVSSSPPAPTPPPDTTPPSVRITYPRNGDTLSGSVVVAVDASDDSGVSKVELYRNGVLFGVDSDAPYEFYWDTASDQDGAYTLVAKAYDEAGNVGESSAVSVNVANASVIKVVDTNPPTVSITQPLDGSKVSKTIDVSVSAWDESGIAKVEFYIDGKLVATDSEYPYAYRWSTRSVKDGWHTIMVRAYDLFSNFAEVSIRVHVSNRK